MCGIFGYALWHVDADRRPSFERATAMLRHRGPDGAGTFIDERTDPICGLAHTRLAIIDLSPGGIQPMTLAGGRYTIVFNGEIYNFRDLRNELESRGASFVSNSDTEVLLVGYQRWGPDLLPRLRGMFSFAIWDAVDRVLFLARDRLGVKPLYYVKTEQGFLFSSEVRTLLDTKFVAPRLSREGVSSYLTFGSVREPETIIAGIAMLQAGCYAVVRNNSLKEIAYWSPPVRIDRRVTRADAVEELSELLRESVSLRLVSDVPVGVFLSGGLDSSAIVALAALSSRVRVNTFTVTFDEAAYNEGTRAEDTALRFGTNHRAIRLSAVRALNEIPDALAALDQPSADGINTYFVSKAVRDAGIAVALSGIGGDELFAGYPSFRRFRAARRLAPLFRSLSDRQTRRLLPIAPFALRKGVSLLCTKGEPFALYSTFRSMLLPDQRERLFPAGHEGAALPLAGDAGISAWETGPEGDSVATYSLFELTNYLRNTLLRDADVMGMAHALEIREPLLDHKLVERALTLPGAMRLSRQRNKPLLVDAVGNLPKLTGPKMGFTLPFDTWLRGPLRGWAEEQLTHSDLLAPNEVQRMWADFNQGKLSYARIWTVLALIHWTRKYGVALAD